MIIFFHMQRVLFDFKVKKVNEITSFDIIAYLLSSLIINKINNRNIDYIMFVIKSHKDKIGMHKSYNILDHSKFINNLKNLKYFALF